MPFCTSVRQAEPRRRPLLLAVRHPAGDRRRAAPAAAGAAGRVDRHDQHRARRRQGRDRPTASSTRSTPRPSTRCPSGHALLVVQRGPGRRQPVPARRGRRQRRPAPRQRDLPRRRDRLAPARGVHTARATLHRQRRRQPQRHLRQPRPHRHASQLKDGDEVQIGKYRLVFFSGPRERADAHGDAVGRRGAPGAARARMNIGEVLDRLRPDFPGDHDPQDPLPRGQGADQARAHARRATASSPTTTSSGCATCCGCSATTTCRSR